MVAAIKRLLPIGLNVFGGPEQELVQLAKDKMIEVIIALHTTAQRKILHSVEESF